LRHADFPPPRFLCEVSLSFPCPPPTFARTPDPFCGFPFFRPQCLYRFFFSAAGFFTSLQSPLVTRLYKHTQFRRKNVFLSFPDFLFVDPSLFFPLPPGPRDIFVCDLFLNLIFPPLHTFFVLMCKTFFIALFHWCAGRPSSDDILLFTWALRRHFSTFVSFFRLPPFKDNFPTVVSYSFSFPLFCLFLRRYGVLFSFFLFPPVFMFITPPPCSSSLYFPLPLIPFLRGLTVHHHWNTF